MYMYIYLYYINVYLLHCIKYEVKRCWKILGCSSCSLINLLYCSLIFGHCNFCLQNWIYLEWLFSEWKHSKNINILNFVNCNPFQMFPDFIYLFIFRKKTKWNKTTLTFGTSLNFSLIAFYNAQELCPGAPVLWGSLKFPRKHQ